MGKHASNFLELHTEPLDLPGIGRHRGEIPSGRRRLDTVALPIVALTAAPDAADPANTAGLVLRPVRRPVVRRRAAGVAVTTATLMMVGGMAGVGTRMSESEPLETGLQPIVASADAVLSPVEVDVTTVPAPPPPPPVAEPSVAPPAPVPAPPVVVAPRPVAPPPPPPPPAPPAIGKAAAIAGAARAQLGRTQDCTMLVTNALAAVGIRHHGWPVSYFALGDVVSYANAMPGDLVYYENGGLGLAHIAVYDGGGMGIHGGWNGNQTVRFSVFVGSGPVFIRVR